MKKMAIIIIVAFCAAISNAQVSFTKNQFINLGDDNWTVMVDTADMDNDGTIEVVCMYLTNGDSMTLGIYNINADSTQTTATTFIIKTGVNINWAMRNFITLDANIQTDNRKDIAYVHSDSVTVLFQKANGTFSLDSSVTMPSGTTADGIAKGDFNNDGRDDFVTSNWNSPYLTMFVQTLGGFYGSNITAVQAGYNQIKVADVNADGWDDILFLAGQTWSSGVYVYLNDAGTFVTTPTYLYLEDQNTGNVTITQSVSWGNFLGYGNRLLLSTNSTYANPNSKLFTSSGTLDQTLSLPDFGKSTAVADFNNDGHDELAALTNNTLDRLMVIEFYPTVVVNSFPSQIGGNFHSLDQAIVCGDVIGNDGKLDIITISDWGGITIWENTFLTTGTKEDDSLLPPSPDISLYPNPATDYLNISGAEDGTSIRIVYYSGRIVLDGSYHGTIDVHGFAPGVYCIQIGKVTKKFIIQ